MKFVFGIVSLLMGLVLACWILYNLFVQRLPETSGRNPIGPLVMAILFIFVGIQWIRGKPVG